MNELDKHRLARMECFLVPSMTQDEMWKPWRLDAIWNHQGVGGVLGSYLPKRRFFYFYCWEAGFHMNLPHNGYLFHLSDKVSTTQTTASFIRPIMLHGATIKRHCTGIETTLPIAHDHYCSIFYRKSYHVSSYRVIQNTNAKCKCVDSGLLSTESDQYGNHYGNQRQWSFRASIRWKYS